MRLILIIPAALGLTACVTPGIQKTNTTLGAVDMTGLVCRNERPVGSNQGRSVCASQQQWAKYDEQMARKTADILDQGNRTTNVDQFGRRGMP